MVPLQNVFPDIESLFLNGTEKLLSCPTEFSVRAQVPRVLCSWYVSICVGLKGGSEVLLIIWVVYAGLGLEGLTAVNCSIGDEREGGWGR